MEYACQSEVAESGWLYVLFPMIGLLQQTFLLDLLGNEYLLFSLFD